MAAAAPPFIRHIHLPASIPFSLATSIQNSLFQQNLSHKALLSTPSTPLPPPPPPTILTFTPDPIYTLGRRESISALTPEHVTLLRSPFTPTRPSPGNQYAQPLWADVVETTRGGQTTFHGPGQVVIYPIFDIKSKFPLQPSGLSVRCYVHLLEGTTIATLKKWGIKGVRTENPGVWEEAGERKIAALGVHLRRNISSYGVALNVNTDLGWFERITACGLEDKSVTSMRELREEMGIPSEGGLKIPLAEYQLLKAKLKAEGAGEQGKLILPLKPHKVVRIWVREFARGLFGESFEDEGRIKRVPAEEAGLPEDVLFKLHLRLGGQFVDDLDEYYAE